ncbi:hypothetical protein [Rhodococcus olei]
MAPGSGIAPRDHPWPPDGGIGLAADLAGHRQMFGSGRRLHVR